MVLQVEHIVNGDFEESLSPPLITVLVNSLLSLIGTSFEYESTHSKWELKGVKEECKLFLFLSLADMSHMISRILLSNSKM